MNECTTDHCAGCRVGKGARAVNLQHTRSSERAPCPRAPTCVLAAVAWARRHEGPLHNRPLCQAPLPIYGALLESHKIAHDRTAKLFDRVLQIDYWRDGHVELCPQLFAVTVRAGRYFVSSAICASDGSITWRYHRVDPSLQPKSTILMLCHPRRGRSTKRRQVFWPKRSHFDRP